jgi:hypothetical protein
VTVVRVVSVVPELCNVQRHDNIVRGRETRQKAEDNMSRRYGDPEDDFFEPTRHTIKKAAANGCHRYDDYEDDGDRGRIEIDEVVRLLKSNNYYRDGLRANVATLKRWLDGSEEFAEAWKDFTISGGISADDFKSFMAGTFRCRRVPRKKHLRLVASAKPQRIKLPR